MNATLSEAVACTCGHRWSEHRSVDEAVLCSVYLGYLLTFCPCPAFEPEDEQVLIDGWRANHCDEIAERRGLWA